MNCRFLIPISVLVSCSLISRQASADTPGTFRVDFSNRSSSTVTVQVDGGVACTLNPGADCNPEYPLSKNQYAIHVVGSDNTYVDDTISPDSCGWTHVGTFTIYNDHMHFECGARTETALQDNTWLELDVIDEVSPYQPVTVTVDGKFVCNAQPIGPDHFINCQFSNNCLNPLSSPSLWALCVPAVLNSLKHTVNVKIGWMEFTRQIELHHKAKGENDPAHGSPDGYYYLCHVRIVESDSAGNWTPQSDCGS